MSDEVSPGFVDLANRLLPRSPVICDIGSRDAKEGIFLLKCLNAGELHVFEPNPAAAELCRGNLSDFQKERGSGSEVFFNESAVSDTIGQLRFYAVNPLLSENKDIGFSSLFQINPMYTRRRAKIVQDEVFVRSTTLDQYFEGKQAPDLLWVDVEGAELQVFRGATSILRSVRLIHVEVSFRPMQLGKPLFWDLEAFLAGFGFSLKTFIGISRLRAFLYRHRLFPTLPWRLNAVFSRED